MKLKILLAALFVAGIATALAVAAPAPGKGNPHEQGTVAGGTITLNVTQAAGPRAKQLGNSAALQVSGKVRVQAWACGASTGNAAPTLYLRQLHVSGSPHNFGSTTTTTGP